MTGRDLLDHWRNRPARERWLIGAPVLALVAVLFYVGLLEPLAESTSRLSRTLPDIEARHRRIKAETSEARAQPSAAAQVQRPTSASAAIVAVQAAIDRQQLRDASPAIERPDETRVRLAFARIAFHSIWPLLEDLQKRSGIRVISLRVDRIDPANARFEATLTGAEARER